MEADEVTRFDTIPGNERDHFTEFFPIQATGFRRGDSGRGMWVEDAEMEAEIDAVFSEMGEFFGGDRGIAFFEEVKFLFFSAADSEVFDLLNGKAIKAAFHRAASMPFVVFKFLKEVGSCAELDGGDFGKAVGGGANGGGGEAGVACQKEGNGSSIHDGLAGISDKAGAFFALLGFEIEVSVVGEDGLIEICVELGGVAIEPMSSFPDVIRNSGNDGKSQNRGGGGVSLVCGAGKRGRSRGHFKGHQLVILEVEATIRVKSYFAEGKSRWFFEKNRQLFVRSAF